MTVSNVSLKEKLKDYFEKKDIMPKIMTWVIVSDYTIKRKFQREQVFHFYRLDYLMARTCYSLIDNNPEIHKKYNLEKINGVIEDWLATCEIVKKSFQKNYPEEFQSSMRNMFGNMIGENTIKELAEKRGLNISRKEEYNDEHYKSYEKKLQKTYGYTEKQAKIMIQQCKTQNYVKGRLRKEEPIEEKLKYINEYIDCEERKEIKETFYKIMQIYKVFDPSVVKTKKFNYKKASKITVPIAIIATTLTIIGLFFIVIIVGVSIRKYLGRIKL